MSEIIVNRLLAQASHTEYRSGRLIRTAEASPKGLSVVQQGVVALSIKSGNEDFTIDYVNTRQCFDEQAVFKQAYTPASAVLAKTDCVVAVIPFGAINALKADLRVQIYEWLCKTMVERIRRAESRMKCFIVNTNSTAEERVLATIRYLASQPSAISHPEGWMISASVDELAKFSGCCRHSAGDAIRKLEDKRIIRKEAAKAHVPFAILILESG